MPVKKISYPVDMLMEGLPEITMMKIDTQGSELEVLKGASHVLKDVEVLYITVPLMRIHRGAPLALEILSYCSFAFLPFGIYEDLCGLFSRTGS